MSYRCGDFYGYPRHGYYQGDPGFFSSLGGALKGAVVGYLTGGPAGAVAGAVGGLATHRQSSSAAGAGMAAAPAGMSGAEAAGYQVGKAVMPAANFLRQHPVISAAGGAAVAGGAMELMHHGGAVVAGGRRGVHMSKPYKCHGTVIPSHPVRNRRMNVCNPRALRRAIRRAHGFTKLAMRTIHLVHPKKHGRFAGFKKRRRK